GDNHSYINGKRSRREQNEDSEDEEEGEREEQEKDQQETQRGILENALDAQQREELHSEPEREEQQDTEEDEGSDAQHHMQFRSRHAGQTQSALQPILTAPRNELTRTHSANEGLTFLRKSKLHSSTRSRPTPELEQPTSSADFTTTLSPAKLHPQVNTQPHKAEPRASLTSEMTLEAELALAFTAQESTEELARATDELSRELFGEDGLYDSDGFERAPIAIQTPTQAHARENVVFAKNVYQTPSPLRALARG